MDRHCSMSQSPIPRLPRDLEAAALEAAWQGGHAAVLDRMQEQHTAEMVAAISQALLAKEEEHQRALAQQAAVHRVVTQVAVREALKNQETQHSAEVTRLEEALKQKDVENREIVASAARAKAALQVNSTLLCRTFLTHKNFLTKRLPGLP